MAVSLPRLADLCLGQSVDFHSFNKGHKIVYTGVVTEIKADLMETLLAWRHHGSNGEFWTDIRVLFVEKGTGHEFMIMFGEKVQLDEETHQFRCWYSRSNYDPLSEYHLSKTMFHVSYDEKGQHTLKELVTTNLFRRWDAKEEEPTPCL